MKRPFVAPCPRDRGQHTCWSAWARRAYKPTEHVSSSRHARLCPSYQTRRFDLGTNSGSAYGAIALLRRLSLIAGKPPLLDGAIKRLRPTHWQQDIASGVSLWLAAPFVPWPVAMAGLLHASTAAAEDRPRGVRRNQLPLLPGRRRRSGRRPALARASGAAPRGWSLAQHRAAVRPQARDRTPRSRADKRPAPACRIRLAK